MLNKQETMQVALKLAIKAYRLGEVPVGAVVVKDGMIVSTGYNSRESKKNAIWHAEMIAIDKACKKLRSWRLNDCELFVTLEPCMMCIGACANARIKKVYFGAYSNDSKLKDVPSISILNHNVNLEGGIYQKECENLIKKFFEERRNVKN